VVATENLQILMESDAVQEGSWKISVSKA